MARVRRKATTTVRLNLEIAGIAAIGFAALLAIALVLPGSRSGVAGTQTALLLHFLFGRCAPAFPLLIGLAGAIVFLEINVPRMIATLGSAALGYFLIVAAVYGPAGGVVGGGLAWGLRTLVGEAGADVVLAIAALSITVAITKVSLKRVIGWCIVRLAALRPAPAEPKARDSKAPPAPETLREAFHLPAVLPSKPKRARALSRPFDEPLAAPEPARAAAIAEPSEERLAASAGTAFDEALDVDLNEEVDEEDYDDETLEEIVEAEQADEFAEPHASAESATVSGEYESAAATAAHTPLYRLPDLSILDPVQVQKLDETSRAHTLEDTLASFGVGAKVVHIERGPSITRYELKPERGVKISRISSLADDLALSLAATSVRIEAPIPGKSAVGIEIPNATVSVVALREILEALPMRGTIPPLNMALGKDITGRPVFGDLAKMPHVLVAGATGSGKSVCLNAMIASLLVSARPDQVQMLFIDPKRVELTVYNGIPHLIKEVITDPRFAAGALLEMTREMDTRYERFAKAGVRKIEEYNAKFPDEKLPYVMIVIDELADLMLVAPAKVETTICRLAQLARATGIHLVVATQRPSVDVITGIIKANIPSRIAFAVSSQIDSRTILDMGGAERLLGRGDMLYLPIDAPKPVRAQGALVTNGEVGRLVDFWTAQARPENLLEVEVTPVEDDAKNAKDLDPLCYDAAKFIIESNFASTAQLQSQFSIGHPRAVRVMKLLEEFKVVGPHEGTKPRKILLGLGDLEAVAPRMGRRDDGRQDLFSAS